MRKIAVTGAVCAALAWAGAATATERSAHTNYVLRCTGCHGIEGAGSEQAGIPDFRGYVGSFARTEEGRRYLMHVPGVTNAALSDAEVAAVMNYVMDRFAGASADPATAAFTASEVARLRAERVADVVALRRAVAAEYAQKGWPVAGYPWP